MFPPADDPGPSFTDLLRRGAPPQPFGAVVPRAQDIGRPAVAGPDIRHGTTVAALRYLDGVVMAGDRRATEGYSIAHRAIEKVFPADRHSAVAFAGAAGPGIEMVRLFQTQLEHYEKVEGLALSLEGKANQLGQMIRGNLGMALQGLAVVPLFAGYDLDLGRGRIFSYDVTGGMYEEHRFYSVGSGSLFARGSLKKIYRDDFDAEDATVACVQALYDAADDDSATGGPDLFRRIFPVVAVVTEDGYRRIPDNELSTLVEGVMDARRVVPDGPQSPLR
jgi:proteasome beta subunit